VTGPELSARVTGLLLALVLLVTPPVATAAASKVQLSIRDGSVWLVVDDATPAEVLAEWTRVGHTRIVNAERLPGPRLKLELTSVPEYKALEIVLRSASGFVAVARSPTPEDDRADLSGFERILILPVSAPAITPAPAAVPAESPAPPSDGTATAPGVQRILGPDGRPVPDDQDTPSDAPASRPEFVPLPPGFAPPPAR
jgi:hypothetical protein